MRTAAATASLSVICLLTLVSAGHVSAAKDHGGRLSIWLYSAGEGPSRAHVGASIDDSRSQPGSRSAPGAGSTPGSSTDHSGSSGTVTSGTGETEPAPTYPSLPTSSPWLQSPTPRGPTTFWYADGSGHACIYIPDSSADCYTLTQPAAGQTPPEQVDPATVAASIAEQEQLRPGTISTSPAASGVTGTISWFWLDPAPTAVTGSISIAGETVTLTATPTVHWSFGDGATGTGPGVPYRAGTPPPAAVTHLYQTRCLPGDAGSDPNVLPSCQRDGYAITAQVSWRLSYQATGALAESGMLPTRTTDATTAYPVSEVRAFLTGSSA